MRPSDGVIPGVSALIPATEIRPARLVAGTSNNLTVFAPAAQPPSVSLGALFPPGAEVVSSEAGVPSWLSGICENPAAIQAALRGFPDMPWRVIVGHCGRCQGCKVRRGRSAYERCMKQAKQIIAREVDRTGLSLNEYCRRHMRMLTVTVNSPRYMRNGKRYTVMAFGKHMEVLSRKIRRMKGREEGFSYYVQIETNGPTAGYRLHAHILLIGVAEDVMEWRGPDVESREKPITRAAWEREIEYDRKARFARDLLATGFWGVSDCRRVDSVGGAIHYVTKEMNTADIHGEVTPKLLDRIYCDESTGKRIRGQRYAKGFYHSDADAEDSDAFCDHVPLWVKQGYVPPGPYANALLAASGYFHGNGEVSQSRLPLEPEQWAHLRRSAVRESLAKMRESPPEAVEGALDAACEAARKSEAFRKARDELLWTSYIGATRRELFGKWQTAELIRLAREVKRCGRRARALRDAAGVAPWLMKRRRLLRAEVALRRS